jgi:steroid delta-isomerase-like uncharacterized protein
MRTLLSVLLALLSVAGAFAQTTPAAVVTRRFEALNRHDLAALETLYADSARIESVEFEGPKVGPAGIRWVYSQHFAGTPELTYAVDRLLPCGDDVVVQYRFGGTLTQPGPGVPAYMKDKPYSLAACAVFTVQNGKIIRERTYFDQVAFLRQMGFFEQK